MIINTQEELHRIRDACVASSRDIPVLVIQQWFKSDDVEAYTAVFDSATAAAEYVNWKRQQLNKLNPYGYALYVGSALHAAKGDLYFSDDKTLTGGW